MKKTIVDRKDNKMWKEAARFTKIDKWLDKEALNNKFIHSGFVTEYNTIEEVNKDAVSVVIQTYNSQKYIKRAIESVYKQANVNDEVYLYILDDASTDNTIEVAKKTIENRKTAIPTTIIFSPPNNKIKVRGKYHGCLLRAYAFLNLETDYVMFLDSDDYWTENLTIAKQLEYLRKDLNTIMCWHSIQQFLEDKQSFGVVENSSAFPIPSTWMFRNVFEKIPAALLNSQNDDIVMLHFFQKMGQIYFIENVGPTIYNIRESSSFSSMSTKEKKKHLLNTKWQLFKMYKWSWPKIVLLKNIFAIWVKG